MDTYEQQTKKHNAEFMDLSNGLWYKFSIGFYCRIYILMLKNVWIKKTHNVMSINSTFRTATIKTPILGSNFYNHIIIMDFGLKNNDKDRNIDSVPYMWIWLVGWSHDNYGPLWCAIYKCDPAQSTLHM